MNIIMEGINASLEKREWNIVSHRDESGTGDSGLDAGGSFEWGGRLIKASPQAAGWIQEEKGASSAGAFSSLDPGCSCQINDWWLAEGRLPWASGTARFAIRWLPSRIRNGLSCRSYRLSRTKADTDC